MNSLPIGGNMNYQKIENIIFGTHAVPIHISSWNAFEYFMYTISQFLLKEYDIDVFIPKWFFLKLLIDRKSNLIKDLIINAKPLKLKNININIDDQDRNTRSYIYINDKNVEYISIIEWVPEP